MKAAERNYSHLEGKIINVIDGSDKCNALVVGCDYYIGITLVDADDNNEYLYCLSGPYDPSWNREWNDLDWKIHNAAFFCAVRSIKNNFINFSMMKTIDRKILGYRCKFNLPSSEVCPFNQ